MARMGLDDKIDCIELGLVVDTYIVLLVGRDIKYTLNERLFSVFSFSHFFSFKYSRAK